MPEVKPRIAYSDDGILTLRRSTAYSSLSGVDKSLEGISRQRDHLIRESDGGITVDADIKSILRQKEGPRKVIDLLGPFACFDAGDSEDGIFSLDWWGYDGAGGVVYPHLQRWMNTDLLTEDLARKIYDAMAEPFDRQTKKMLNRGFSYTADDRGISAGNGGMSVNLALHNDRFGLERSVLADGSSEYGEVNWRWPGFGTVGSCACWGVDGTDRERVDVSPGVQRLYTMPPHNVDVPAQSLSLVLGMARMASAASEYSGTEDILENAEWH
ncbi:hypothetical protein KA075_01585 [Candidatus Saccharibacteria bacterium]|nr:hypothetical protein [Candidatus Saccharibacteria bacterium]